MESKVKSDYETASLPPKIPGTAEGISRVICLLGNRTKAELKRKAQQELIDLIGTYPNIQQAAEWKKSLRQLSKSE
ncbi:MAG: hypothetical protein F6K36_14440 [Symploca sp. SIO3C6]|uniref:Uncharacterized protein n=1 Tax=Symploca sp. SIO1C4 TaxID=2607765 RepID=A0A6B3N9S1_9CYAN|nr:hypothetical protein [Symploca sp. SIO3C6]NER28253.1 hypothetical protein [Symploca sp. SIO1C4]NET06544.1 hypothetical protein [Symploca sp. SIO2B6]NET48725.1 hypothetical protein [Merismopedia sp. SIO2A8]